METNQRRICPECNGVCLAEWVDIGVGIQQVGPYHCQSCGWTQDCPHKNDNLCNTCASATFCSHNKNTNRGKNISLQEFKDKMAKQLFGSTLTDAKETGICIKCKEPALEKCYSKAGKKEFYISGLCELCFDKLISGDM